MATRSRLAQTIDKRTKTRLVFSVVGILAILFLVIRFGIPALINFSLFLASIKGNGAASTTTGSSQSILLPPTLNQPFTATNSGTIIVSGTSQANSTVELYVNNQLVHDTTVDDTGLFTFRDVSINPGSNTIQARAKTDKAQSILSDPMIISYMNKQPSLTLDNPHNGDNISKDNNPITVSGKTDPDVKVTVNGFWATTDASGNYSYTLSLQNGDNQIKVIATDQASNTIEKDITVHYSQ